MFRRRFAQDRDGKRLQEEYARSLRKNPNALGEQEKKQAFVNKTLDKAFPESNVIAPLAGLDLEDKEAEEAMRNCICPRKGCPVHPAV